MEQNNEELFEAIYENGEMLVFGLDAEGRITIFNPVCERVSGYRAEEVIGRHMRDFLIPERVKTQIAELFEDFQSGRAPDFYENSWLTKNGEERTISWKTCAIYDEQKRPKTALGLGVDITDLLREEEELSRSEEHFRLLIENSLDLVAILNRDGSVSYFGPSVEPILGYKPGDLLGRSIFELVHPDDLGVGKEALAIAMRRPGKTEYAELRIRHKDGSWRLHEVSSYNLLDDPNVKGLVINSRDITERNQAERLVQVQRDLAIKLSGTSDPTEVLETSFKAILEASDLDCGGMHIFDQVSGGLDLAYHEGVSEAFAGEIAHYDPDSPMARLVKAGNPVYANYREMDLPTTDARVKEGIKAGATIPIKSEGDVIGSVSVASHILDEMPRHSIDIIEMLAGQIGQAIARSRLASALRDSEERFRLLYDRAGEAIFTYDRDMKIMSVNRIGCEEIGYSEEELIGRSILELGLLQPDEIEKAATNFQELMSSGKPVRAEYRLTRRDGSPFYIDNTATPLYNEKGELIAISNIALDITEKREAEETLRRSEEHFRTLIEKTFDVITILDGMGIIRYESPSIKEVLGYEQDELVGKSIFDYLHPEDMQVTLEAFQAGLEIPGNSSNMEVRFRHKDGSWRWFTGTGSNFLEDPAIQGILLNSRDINESKQIDRILRENEGKYRATFESTGTAMFLVDKDAVISDANREMEKTFGYSHEEVVGKMRYMEFLMPEDVELVKGNSLKLARGELEGPIQYEVRARHKTGRIIEALISINMLPEIEQSVVSLIDITEKKNYERELLERAEQLKDFLDIAAHELRHPTTLLKGYALTLQKHWETFSPQTLNESLEAMGIGADRLVHVVQELLDMSRTERKTYPMVKEEVALEPLVERAVNEMLAKDSDVEIRFEFRDRFGSVKADPESLVRLLIILLDNAVKYSPPGSMVEVIVERDDENLIISVLDRGMGVPEEDRESIFERFYQVEEVLHHSHPGLGLGLYIGRRIAEEHGGKIWYEPREGGGTAFRFTLPLDEAPP